MIIVAQRILIRSELRFNSMVQIWGWLTMVTPIDAWLWTLKALWWTATKSWLFSR